jgi:hypothetical protein
MNSELYKLIFQPGTVSDTDLETIFEKHGDALNPFLLKELETMRQLGNIGADHFGRILFILKTSYQYNNDQSDAKLIEALVVLFDRILDKNRARLGKDRSLDQAVLFMADFLFHSPKLLKNSNEEVRRLFVTTISKLYDVRYEEDVADDFYLAIHYFMTVLHYLKTTYSNECLRKYLDHHDGRIQDEAKENLELNG